MKKYGTPRDLESLQKHRLLFYTRLSDRPILSLVDQNKKNIAFRFDPHLQSDGSDLIRESILKGVGIALLPSWMMINYEKLCIEPLQKFVGPASPIYILSSSSQEMNAKQKAFADFLREAFEPIPALSVRL